MLFIESDTCKRVCRESIKGSPPLQFFISSSSPLITLSTFSISCSSMDHFSIEIEREFPLGRSDDNDQEDALTEFLYYVGQHHRSSHLTRMFNPCFSVENWIVSFQSFIGEYQSRYDASTSQGTLQVDGFPFVHVTDVLTNHSKGKLKILNRILQKI